MLHLPLIIAISSVPLAVAANNASSDIGLGTNPNPTQVYWMDWCIRILSFID